MNSFPLGVSELLLAPPPPPPPLSKPSDSAATNHGQAENARQAASDQNNHTPGYSNQYQQDRCPPHQHQAPALHMQNIPPHGMSAHPPNNQGLMMIPPRHLSLPPPPPPPPLEVSNEPSNTAVHYGVPYSNNSAPNIMRLNNQKSYKPHPYRGRGGPSPWACRGPPPSGLQGPWQAPNSERPTGVFEQLHPPGVPGEHHLESESIGENNLVLSSEPTFPSDAGSESKFTPAPTTYKDHKVNPKDPRLPKELTQLFEALHCLLCEVQSSSTVQAAHHYSGKPHEKKVRQWLQKWSEETGQPMPKRQKVETPIADINPEDLYCRLCDVAFTSVKHGEQHKMGKPHQKALKLGYNPAKTKKKIEVPLDPTGRFGIGESFKKETQNASSGPIQAESNQDAIPASSSTAVVKGPPLNCKFYCELCQVSTTSQDHLDSHYVGAKHRKAVLNAARAGIKTEVSVVPPAVEPAESILASVIGINDGSSRSRIITTDLSIYRTPSGQFYCHPCNTTVNSEKSFKEHTESKRHKFKVASSKHSKTHLD